MNDTLPDNTTASAPIRDVLERPSPLRERRKEVQSPGSSSLDFLDSGFRRNNESGIDQYFSEDITQQIIALEEEALRRWCAGDPSGFLDISAELVIYCGGMIEASTAG